MLWLAKDCAGEIAETATVLVEDEEESTKERQNDRTALNGQESQGAEHAGWTRIQSFEDVHGMKGEGLVVGLAGQLRLERADNRIGCGQRDAVLSFERRRQRSAPERVRDLANLEGDRQANGHDDSDVHQKSASATQGQQQQAGDGEHTKGDVE